MNLLRIVLLGLAAIVIVALGWRLTETPPTRPLVAAGAPTVPAARSPAVPAPLAPRVPGPSVAVPTPPTSPAAPQPAASPADPQQTTTPTVPPPATQGGAPVESLTAQAARQRIDAVLQSAPVLDQAFDMLKAQFPVVADRSLAEATDALRRSGAVPTPDDLFASAMRDLRQSSGVLAAKAGPEALSGLFDMKAATLADLEQADPRICADYLFGGTSPEFADFEAGHRALVAKAALANIQAMADGRTRQMDWGMPSADDIKWIEDALTARGLSPDEIGALLDGKSVEPPLTDTRLCDNARTYLDVLHAMPQDARNRVYGLAAELLARS